MKDSTTMNEIDIETTELAEMDVEALEAVVGGARVPEETMPVCPSLDEA